jgi:small-conductance mechanosensitive channel
VGLDQYFFGGRLGLLPDRAGGLSAVRFVCGLILLFERPVHMGDIIEVGGLEGEVRRIGIRSSTVRTYQGPSSSFPMRSS